MSSYLLPSELKEVHRYPYTYEETEAQRAEQIVQSPPNGSVHNDSDEQYIYLVFVHGQGSDESFVLSYPYLKKLPKTCVLKTGNQSLVSLL